jgi:hypothetical protein
MSKSTAKKQTDPQEKNKYHEPEETSSAAENADIGKPPVDFDPITDEAAINRAHTTTGTQQQTGPMPEYKIKDPVIDEQNQGAADQPPGKEKEPEQWNEDVKDLPPGAKEAGAEFVADKAIWLYGEAKNFIGNQFIPIKEKKLVKLEAKGEIDLTLPLIMTQADGTHINVPAITAIREFNTDARDPFPIRPEFVEVAKPILTEEFSKRGIAVTPMQQLAIAVGMDLYQDAQIAMELRRRHDNLIDAFKEATRYYRQSNGTVKGNFAPPPQTPAPETGIAPEPEIFVEETEINVAQQQASYDQAASSNLTGIIDQIQGKRGMGAPVNEAYQEQLAKERGGKPKRRIIKRKRTTPTKKAA